MQAVFVSGGKQYRVRKNQILQIEKLDSLPGSKIEFNQILMISNQKTIKIGHPFLLDSKIEAFIESHQRGKKIKIIKFNRRKHYKKQQGHRQYFTNIRIIDIQYSRGE